VCFFCFDCLYINGQSLLEKPLRERREALFSAMDTEPGLVEFAKQEVFNTVEEIQASFSSLFYF